MQCNMYENNSNHNRASPSPMHVQQVDQEPEASGPVAFVVRLPVRVPDLDDVGLDEITSIPTTCPQMFESRGRTIRTRSRNSCATAATPDTTDSHGRGYCALRNSWLLSRMSGTAARTRRVASGTSATVSSRPGIITIRRLRWRWLGDACRSALARARVEWCGYILLGS